MSRIVKNGLPYDTPGDAEKIAAIVADAGADPKLRSTHGATRNGWEVRYRNRLMREAGCGYSVALRHIGKLRYGTDKGL